MVIIDPGRPFVSVLVRCLEERGFTVERVQVAFETLEGPQESTLITAVKGTQSDLIDLLRSLR